MSSAPLGRVAAVSALATILTLAIAAPVLRSPAERVFGAEIVGRYHDPFTVMEQFEGPVIGRGVYWQPVTDLPGALLARATGGVAAYNWLVLISFPLAAAAAYLLARHLAISPAGATFAALAYAFSPFHLAHAAYHPHIAQTQWLPFYLLALWRCLDNASPRAVGWLGAATLAVTLSNFYGGLIAAVLTPVAVVAYWALAGRPGGRSVRTLGITVATLALIATGGVAYVWFAARGVVTEQAAFAFPRADLFLYSAKWWSYLVPPLAHPWLGAVAHRIWNAAGVDDGLLEQQVSLGWGVIALGLVAIGWWLLGNRRLAPPARVPVLVLVAIAALACSLSPERTIGGLTIVRPSALLFEVVPMFRAYARFGTAVQLMAALLAGVGVDRLRRTGSQSAQIACIALVSLAAAEYVVAPSTLWRYTLPTAAHRWVARQPGPMRALDCEPVERHASSVGWLTRGRISPLGKPFESCAEPDLPARLAAAGFSHLVVRHDTWESRRIAERTADGLRLQARFEDADLLAIGATPPAVYTAETAAFSFLEHDGNRTWRWMGADATWRVINTRPRQIVATLDLEVSAFHSPRRMELRLDGRRVQTLTIEPSFRPHQVGPLELSPGVHELLFHPVDPATVADDLLHNGDQRALSFALGDWTWKVE